MQVVREITEDEFDSDVEYSTFEAEENSGSVQHLQKEVQAEVFAALHLRSVEEDSPQHKCSQCLKCTKRSVMVFLVVFIWMAMTVPSIIYAQAFFRSSNSSRSNTSNSSSPIYMGQACRSDLSVLRDCLYLMKELPINDNYNICISMDVDQKINEETVTRLQKFENFARPECLMELRPFICLYFFPLVICERDSNGDSEVYGPTKEHCRRIRDNVCQQEWSLAKGFRENLPDCEKLKSPRDLLDSQCLNTGNSTSDCNETKCSDGFMCSNGSCYPVCQVWSPFSARTILITDILVISTSVFALVSCIAVLVIGCCRCKKIYSYPSIFIIYQTIPLMAIAGLVLIGYTDRVSLFCKDPDLRKAREHPSPFCLVTGFAFHYFIIQLPFWWLCHVITVFLSTLFPYQMRRIECTKRLRCLHVFMVAAGILLPMGSMAAVAASYHPGFNLTRFPTYLCSGTQSEVVFFAVILPICVAIAIGLSLMVFILSRVIKRHIQAHVHQLRVRLDWTTEAKVFIVLFYYLVVGVTIIGIFTRALTTLDDFESEALEYFSCESRGVMASPPYNGSTDTSLYSQDMYEDAQNFTSCDRTGIEKFSDATSTTIAFVLLGIYPLVYLIYTINCKELKETLCTRTVREVEPSQKTTTTGRKGATPKGYYSPMMYNTNTLASNAPGSDHYNRPTTFTPHST